MKKLKTLVSIFMIITMLISYCPISFATLTEADNGQMYYYKNSSDHVDIKGYVNGELQSTTFMDGGYKVILKVDDNEPTTLYLNDYNLQQGVNGVKYDIDCSFINNGRYVKMTYTLKNTENVNKTISLGTAVDVQIAGNDYATIERYEGSKGLKLYNEEANIQFNFYGKSVVGTTDIDNLWVGNYWDYDGKEFDNNTTNKLEREDSAFTYSWTNRTLAAGATNTYSVIIGIGEVSNAPRIQLDENQGKCFSQDAVIINGTITDMDANSKATLYYKIDGGTENHLNEEVLTNNKLDFALDLTSQNLTLGDHTVELWAIDESGNPSEIVEKEIYITNLKAPTLNMSEEWSKEPVKFTITDTLNDVADVSKYQYKIGDGEWQDVELDTEVEALNTTGTVVVSARTLGNETNEYSSIVSKTAKVDKDAPVVVITENEGKVTIDVTDEHSGVESTKYIFTNSEELDGEEEFVDYTEAVEYKGQEEKDVYLHVITIDKLGNENTVVKEYKYPVAAEIKTEEKFIVAKPVYKLEDSKNQNCTYEVKINDGEWQVVNLNTDYTIENPVEGKNTIVTRTIDLLGRVSKENKVEIIYEAVDTTVSNSKLPDTGSMAINMLALTILAAVAIIGMSKYNKLRDIR